VRAPKKNTRGFPLIVSVKPARRTQTPRVTRFEAGKTKGWHGRAQIITLRARVSQKLIGHGHANRVTAMVDLTRIAAAIAEETGNRIHSTGLEGFAKNIDRLIHLHASTLYLEAV
jgi:hypothetical protein